jgi:hypothetical protein
LATELARWDTSGGEALILTFFSDERPLRGAAGLADWRLCGRLSRLIRSERLVGVRGEVMMMPPGRRLPFGRILLFGLGPSEQFGEAAYCEHVNWILDVVARAGVTSYALQPPGRATGLIAPRTALQLWLAEMARRKSEAEVAIIDSPGAHKLMSDILNTARRPRERTSSPPGAPVRAAEAASEAAATDPTARRRAGGAPDDREPG